MFVFSRQSVTASAQSSQFVSIETLEDRRLLSAAPAAIPTAVVGQPLSGILHLRYHALPGVKAHGAFSPVMFEVGILSESALQGTISATSDGGVNFNASVSRRSFQGVFAEGTIAGTVSKNGAAVHGNVREIVNGQTVTGTFSAGAGKVIAAKSPKRSAAQSSSSTGVATTASSSAGTTASTSAFAISIAPTESILLPALQTSFLTAGELNEATTFSGSASSDANLSSGISGQETFVGSQQQGAGINQTNNGGTGNSNYSFSTSSGVVSVVNSGNSYTSSSGIVSITSPTNYSQSSGLTPIFGG